MKCERNDNCLPLTLAGVGVIGFAWGIMELGCQKNNRRFGDAACDLYDNNPVIKTTLAICVTVSAATMIIMGIANTNCTKATNNEANQHTLLEEPAKDKKKTSAFCGLFDRCKKHSIDEPLISSNETDNQNNNGNWIYPPPIVSD